MTCQCTANASPEERNRQVRTNIRLLRSHLVVFRNISRKTARDCPHHDIIESLIRDTAEAIEKHNAVLVKYAERKR